MKPSVNQVNLESCCVMPRDLTDFAKATSIQLLTHNDKPGSVHLPFIQILSDSFRFISDAGIQNSDLLLLVIDKDFPYKSTGYFLQSHSIVCFFPAYPDGVQTSVLITYLV